MGALLRGDSAVTRATLDPEESGAEIPSLAIRLDEAERTDDGLVLDSTWELRVEAQTRDGSAEVGRLFCLPPTFGAPLSRYVGFAGCPGAIRWHVEARLIFSSGRGRAMLHMAASPCCSELGLRPSSWSAVRGIQESAGTYFHGTLTGNGSIPVPVGARVESFAVAADTASDATLTITGLPAITIPAGRNYSRERPRGMVGPLTFTAAGDPLSVVVAFEA